MKRLLITAALISASAATTAMAADVGVSVSIGQPGFYGRIDLGGFPPPPVVYSQPVVVERVVVERPPLYLRVPPGHARHWREHCREYNACGERVFFVQDNWYKREYAPRYQERHREERREERHEEHDHDHDRGHGHDHDHDHDHDR